MKRWTPRFCRRCPPAWAVELDAKLGIVIAQLEIIMSDTSGLTSALADLKTEIGNIGTRMDENFAALQAALASDDQSVLDAATAEIRSDIDALKAIETRDTPPAP